MQECSTTVHHAAPDKIIVGFTYHKTELEADLAASLTEHLVDLSANLTEYEAAFPEILQNIC
jgi:hypothetical protein